MSHKKRDGRKPFTFWFDLSLKENLKKTALQLGTTTTELLNQAVNIYLEKGFLFGENIAKQTSFNIANELEISSKINEKVNPIGIQMKGLISRIEQLEKSGVGDLDIDSIREMVMKQIRITMLDKINPIFDQILNTIAKLESGINAEK